MRNDSRTVDPIASVSAEVAAYFADAHPSVDRHYRVPIEEQLEIARSFCDRPYPFAQQWLSLAEQSFAAAKKQLDDYGGPQNARVITPR